MTPARKYDAAQPGPLEGLEQTVESLARFPEENPNPVMRVTPDARIIYANSAAKRIMDRFGIAMNVRLPAPYPDRIAAVYRTGQPGIFNALVGERTYAFNATPVMEAGYLNLYGHDETKARDLKVARDVAEQTARSKSEFLANMSHEIRTPMNGIVGMSDMLAQTDLTAHQRTLAEIIQSSSQSLLTILNDILDFSKLEAGQFSLVSEPFAIRSVVEGVATLLSTQSSEKDVEMLVRIASGVPEQLVGDAGRVRQILMNIVGNAVKFTTSGYVLIDVKAKRQDASRWQLVINVADSGVGIPPEELERIFDKFSQVDASRTRNHDGTGLGLAIASSLVELMDGRISVRSKPNRGSIFTFTIMAGQDEEGAAPTVPRFPMVAGKQVLIVEPNDIGGQILREMLTEMGCQTCLCRTAAEALAAHKTCGPYSAYILDKSVAGALDGLTPRLLLMGMNETDIRGTEGEANAADLYKPVYRDALARAVVGVVG